MNNPLSIFWNIPAVGVTVLEPGGVTTDVLNSLLNPGDLKWHNIHDDPLNQV